MGGSMSVRSGSTNGWHRVHTRSGSSQPAPILDPITKDGRYSAGEPDAESTSAESQRSLSVGLGHRGDGASGSVPKKGVDEE